MIADNKSPGSNVLSPSDSLMEPGPAFIAPQSGFFLGTVEQTASFMDFMDFLPSRPAADRLLTHYHRSVHPIAQCVYWPSLEMSYKSFWTNIGMGIEPTASLQALIFSILFSAAVSMPEHLTMSTFGVEHRTLISSFQRTTEMALSKAHFLRTTKIETLQALIIFIVGQRIPCFWLDVDLNRFLCVAANYPEHILH